MMIPKISKKGQGLSLNVIIVAALALIVLVVLVVIFTQQTGQFQEGVSKEGKAELIKMKIFYGNCHPGEASENVFISQFESTGSAQGRDEASSDFRDEIDRCKGFGTDRATCEDETGCVWS